MGFKWKVTLGDGSVQYPVSGTRINGLPKVETTNTEIQVPILISHQSYINPDEIGYQITTAIRTWAWYMGQISHGKTFEFCVQAMRSVLINTTPPVYNSPEGPEFCISNVVLEFVFAPGYGDDVTDTDMRTKLNGIRDHIDSHLNDFWPMSSTLVSMFGGF